MTGPARPEGMAARSPTGTFARVTHLTVLWTGYFLPLLGPLSLWLCHIRLPMLDERIARRGSA